MRKVLIGAFVLSVMMVPAVAWGTANVEINAFTGKCQVLDEDEEHTEVTGATISVTIKPNGGATAKCRAEGFDIGDEGREFNDIDHDRVCIITIAESTEVIATEWEQKISSPGGIASDDGKMRLLCTADEQPTVDFTFCERHPMHQRCP